MVFLEWYSAMTAANKLQSCASYCSLMPRLPNTQMVGHEPVAATTISHGSDCSPTERKCISELLKSTPKLCSPIITSFELLARPRKAQIGCYSLDVVFIIKCDFRLPECLIQTKRTFLQSKCFGFQSFIWVCFSSEYIFQALAMLSNWRRFARTHCELKTVYCPLDSV